MQAATQATKRLVLNMRIRCGMLTITTTVSLLANKFDVQSVLHGQSLATVNYIYAFHEVVNSCKNLKDSLGACFESVNITISGLSIT